MKSRISMFAGAAIGTIAAAPAMAAEQTFEVGPFKGVSVSAGIIADIAVGSSPTARAEGTDEGVAKLEVLVKNDELIIRRKPMSGFNWGDKQRVKVFVTTPALAAIDVSSGASATATNIDSSEFAADVSSGALATVSGKCGSLAADASSGARLDAAALLCDSVAADGSSGASLHVHAAKAIIADASSGASVKVSGGPKSVSIDESSGGDVSIDQ